MAIPTAPSGGVITQNQQPAPPLAAGSQSPSVYGGGGRPSNPGYRYGLKPHLGGGGGGGGGAPGGKQFAPDFGGEGASGHYENSQDII